MVNSRGQSRALCLQHRLRSMCLILVIWTPHGQSDKGRGLVERLHDTRHSLDQVRSGWAYERGSCRASLHSCCAGCRAPWQRLQSWRASTGRSSTCLPWWQASSFWQVCPCTRTSAATGTLLRCNNQAAALPCRKPVWQRQRPHAHLACCAVSQAGVWWCAAKLLMPGIDYAALQPLPVIPGVLTCNLHGALRLSATQSRAALCAVAGRRRSVCTSASDEPDHPPASACGLCSPIHTCLQVHLQSRPCWAVAT